MHSEPSERCKGGSVAPQGHAGGAGAGVIGAVLRAVELRAHCGRNTERPWLKQKLNSHCCAQAGS